MDQSSQVPRAELLSAHSDDSALSLADDKELSDGSYANMHEHSLADSFETNSQASDETLSRVDDRGGRTNQTVDVAEIIRRWTHALQRIHKQSLQLVCLLMSRCGAFLHCLMLHTLYFSCEEFISMSFLLIFHLYMFRLKQMMGMVQIFCGLLMMVVQVGMLNHWLQL